MKNRTFYISCLLAVYSSGHVNAADVTWDIAPGAVGPGNFTITGGTGTWDTTAANWTTDAGANDVAWNNANLDTAVFADVAGTVTLGAPVTVGGLTFSTAGYTITGSTLTLGAAVNTLSVTTGNATVNSLLSGSTGFTKSGSGTLTLGGANTSLTGTVSVNDGALILNNVSALGSTAAADTATIQNGASVQFGVNGTYGKSFILAGGTLQNNVTTATLSGGVTLNAGTNVTNLNAGTNANVAMIISGKITGSGSLSITSTGNAARNIQFSNAANDYSGGTSIGNGVRLNLTTATATMGTGKVTVASGGQLFFGGGGFTTGSGFTNAIDIAGTSWSGDGTPSRGAIRLGTGTILSGSINLLADAAISGGSGTITGAIGGGFNLGLGANAGGTFTLSGNNTYTGTTAVGGTTASTVTLTGTNQSSGYTVTSGSTLNIGNGGTSGNILSSATVANSGTLRFNRSDSLSIANAISGAGAVSQIGAGTTTLSGNSTYTGATNVNAGKLNVTGSLGNTAVTVATGATLTGTGNGITTGVLGGPVTISTGGTLDVGASIGTLGINNALTLNSGSLLLMDLGSAASYDRLIGVTNLTMNGTLKLMLGYTAAAGDSFDLVDWSGTTTGAPVFDLPTLNSGLSWDTSSFLTNGVVTVVPEPAVSLLGAMGALALLRRRR